MKPVEVLIIIMTCLIAGTLIGQRNAPEFRTLDDGEYYVIQRIEMYDQKTGEPVYWLLAQEIAEVNDPVLGKVHEQISPTRLYKLPRAAVKNLPNNDGGPDESLRSGIISVSSGTAKIGPPVPVVYR